VEKVIHSDVFVCLWVLLNIVALRFITDEVVSNALISFFFFFLVLLNEVTDLDSFVLIILFVFDLKGFYTFHF
jgi:hypothetical protein